MSTSGDSFRRIAHSVAYHAALSGRPLPDEHRMALDALSVELEICGDEVDALIEAGSEVGEKRRLAEQSKERSEAQKEESWGPRAELRGHTPIPEMPPSIIPPSLAPWICGIADQACFPREMVAIPAIVGLSSIIGSHARIQPHAHNEWSTPPNLWGGIIGRPGLMKSGAIKGGLSPLLRLERAESERFSSIMRQNRGREASIKGSIAAMSRRMSADEDELNDLYDQLDRLETHERRYTTSDPTPEALGILMAENPRGVLLYRDELSGWFSSMATKGREAARSFYIEAWSGDGSHRPDRVGRGAVHIPVMCVSVIGSIQPGPLERHIASAVSGGTEDDGMLQRFQLLVWPDAMPEWHECASSPSQAFRRDAENLFEDIDKMCLERWDDPARFDASAQAAHDEWRNAHETRLRGEELADTPSFESHMSKYRGLVPSLALVFHMALGNTPRDPIGVYEVELALAWARYLELHARKVYAAELDTGLTSSLALAKRIEDGSVSDAMTIREIQRAGWSGLKSADQVDAAISELEIGNWVRREAKSTGGRPSIVVRLHPETRRGL